MSNERSQYECLSCRAGLHREAGLLRCPTCSASYPIIADLPILIHEAERYLLCSLQLLQDARKRVEERAARLEEIWNEDQLPLGGLKRLQRVTAAELASLIAFEKLLEPVDAFLKGALIDSAEFGMGDPGWQTEALLPYLLRDWKCDQELRPVETLISAALHKHLGHGAGASLLVSGCGAGGLLRALAPGFSRVAGLDLSLPILLAVRELLEGRDLELKIPAASPSGVQIVDAVLQGVKSADSRRVELLASDACQTPFPSGSIHCVITPFLLDVVHDPRQLAREIHRILSDTGIWINYGPSNSPDAIWHFDGAESSAYLESGGFSPVEMACHRNTHLDRRQMDEFASFEDHVCYLFVARKSGHPTWSPPGPGALEEVANVVPVHHRGAELVWRQALGMSSEGDPRTAFLEQETVKGLQRRFEISEAIAQALTLVDGQRTVLEITAKLKEQDPAIDADDAVEAFRLFFQAGLVLPKGAA